MTVSQAPSSNGESEMISRAAFRKLPSAAAMRASLTESRAVVGSVRTMTGWLLVQGPGQQQPLALAAGECTALFAHPGVQAQRELGTDPVKA